MRSEKSRSDKPRGDRSARKKSWGSDGKEGERRRKAPTRDGSSKPSGKPGGESRADRKAKNQEAHAKQHSRKPRRDGKPGGGKPNYQDGPKSPQRYGKRPHKGGGKPGHRKGPNNRPS